MGCFDSVSFACPHCKEKLTEQTKAGPCMMSYFDIDRGEEVPVEIAEGCETDFPQKCYKCGGYYELKMIDPPPRTVKMKVFKVKQEEV